MNLLLTFIVLILPSALYSLHSSLFSLSYHLSSSFLPASLYALPIQIPRPYEDKHHQCATLPISYPFVAFGALESLLNYRNKSIYVGADSASGRCAYRDFYDTRGPCVEEKHALSGMTCNRDLRMHLGRGSAFYQLERLRTWRTQGTIQMVQEQRMLKAALRHLQVDIFSGWDLSNENKTIEFASKLAYFRDNLLMTMHTSTVGQLEWIKKEWMSAADEGMLHVLQNGLWEKVPVSTTHASNLQSLFQNMTATVAQTNPVSTGGLSSLIGRTWHDTLSWAQYRADSDALTTSFDQLVLDMNGTLITENNIQTTQALYASAAVTVYILVQHASLYERAQWKSSVQNCTTNACAIHDVDIDTSLLNSINSLFDSLSKLNTSSLPPCAQQVHTTLLSQRSLLLASEVHPNVELAHLWTHCAFDTNHTSPFTVSIVKSEASGGDWDHITTTLTWTNALQQEFIFVSLITSTDAVQLDSRFPEESVQAGGGLQRTVSAISLIPSAKFFLDNVLTTGATSARGLGARRASSLQGTLFDVDHFRSTRQSVQTMDDALPAQSNTHTRNHRVRSASSPDDCIPGTYFSGLHENCVPCPTGFWSNDGYKHECTNAYHLGSRIQYVGMSTSTSNCNFVCVADKEYRQGDSCEKVPVGKYAVDGGTQLGDCFNPGDQFEFLTAGMQGDPFSCTYVPRAFLTVQSPVSFDPHSNYTISFYMRLDSTLIAKSLDVEDKDAFTVGVAMSALDFSSHDFGLVFLFSRVNNSAGSIHGRMTLRFPELYFHGFDSDAHFAVDNEWHHYAMVHNDNMHTVAFYRDGEHLSAQWAHAPQNSTAIPAAMTIHIGGTMSTVQAAHIPNFRLMPAAFADLSIRSVALPLPLLWENNYRYHNFTCPPSTMWSDYRCISLCASDKMQYSGNDHCSCTFNQYQITDGAGNPQCEWCPLHTLGTSPHHTGKRSCVCMLGKHWSEESQQCETSKQSYPMPIVTWTFHQGDFLDAIQPNEMPQHSEMTVEAPADVLAQQGNSTRLRCNILRDGTQLVMRRLLLLEELPLTLRFSIKGEYSIDCEFVEDHRDEGITYSRLVHIKPRMPHVVFYNRTETIHRTPVVLMLATDVPKTLGAVMYQLDGGHTNSSSWRVYDAQIAPVLTSTQTVRFYLKSKVNSILDGPHRNLTWNIAIPAEDIHAAEQASSPDAPSAAANGLQQQIASSFLDSGVQFCGTNPLVCLLGGGVLVMLSLSCGAVMACCCVLVRKYRQHRMVKKRTKKGYRNMARRAEGKKRHGVGKSVRGAVKQHDAKSKRKNAEVGQKRKRRVGGTTTEQKDKKSKRTESPGRDARRRPSKTNANRKLKERKPAENDPPTPLRSRSPPPTPMRSRSPPPTPLRSRSPPPVPPKIRASSPARDPDTYVEEEFFDGEEWPQVAAPSPNASPQNTSWMQNEYSDSVQHPVFDLLQEEEFAQPIKGGSTPPPAPLRRYSTEDWHSVSSAPPPAPSTTPLHFSSAPPQMNAQWGVSSAPPGADDAAESEDLLTFNVPELDGLSSGDESPPETYYRKQRK